MKLCKYGADEDIRQPSILLGIPQKHRDWHNLHHRSSSLLPKWHLVAQNFHQPIPEMMDHMHAVDIMSLWTNPFFKAESV